MSKLEPYTEDRSTIIGGGVEYSRYPARDSERRLHRQLYHPAEIRATKTSAARQSDHGAVRDQVGSIVAKRLG